MTSETENLVLQILKKLQGDLSELRKDSSEVKQRLGAVEQQLGLLRRDVGIDASLRAMLMSKVDEHSAKLTALQLLH